MFVAITGANDNCKADVDSVLKDEIRCARV
jgi:hypothetical protein